MKTQRSSLFFFVLFGLLSFGSVYGDKVAYYCQTPSSQRDIIVYPDRIAFTALGATNRSPASEVPTLVRRQTADGLLRVTMFEGHRYRIKINIPSQIEPKTPDQEFTGLITQRYQAGHERSYPVTCQVL